MKTIQSTIPLMTIAFAFLGSPILQAEEEKAKKDEHGHAVESYKLETCVVSGKKLGEMGEPHRIMHHGQEVKMCCEKCEAKFEKDPAKYMSKIHSAKGPMTASLESLKGEPFEKAFLKHMVHHHEMGIDMATLVSTHTERPELIAKAKEMISRETDEIEKMTAWLKWQNDSPGPKEDAPGMKMMMGDFNSLKSVRGDPFDLAFLNMMIHHHQGAVQMAELVNDRAEKEPLKEFAKDLISKQTEEIQQLKDWKKAWFPAEPKED
jgi:uncharacterized protein (DUF305 family)